MPNTALIQVLGAVAYGEWKAYEGALAKAEEAATPEDRKTWKVIAAQELRHHRGFVARLRAMGADPDRAMRPYRRALDRYHGQTTADPVEDAVWSYLGEGIADDLLLWLRKVVDPETATFIDTVIADEEEHEGLAVDELRVQISELPDSRRRADRAVRTMLLKMAASGGAGGAPLVAFLRVGRAHELLAAVVSGYVRRVRAIGPAVASS